MDAFVTRKRPRSDVIPDTGRDPSISPPAKRNTSKQNPKASGKKEEVTHADKERIVIDLTDGHTKEASKSMTATEQARDSIPSPIQLNRIQDLPPSSNVDTISLGDILGDPLIKECWLFNYLFDIDFMM